MKKKIEIELKIYIYGSEQDKYKQYISSQQLFKQHVR